SASTASTSSERADDFVHAPQRGHDRKTSQPRKPRGSLRLLGALALLAFLAQPDFLAPLHAQRMVAGARLVALLGQAELTRQEHLVAALVHRAARGSRCW